MPLHLLGKKSWNVYNADNIARVRRDEAAAKAAEEAEEQRMQEVDAERRIAILRGEAPPPIEDVEETMKIEPAGGSRQDAYSGSMRRKRKRQGEDDTDFELRVAREKNELSVAPLTTERERKPTSSAPIVDRAGHIDLFGDEKFRAHAEKNEEAEKEAKKKKQSFEDQYTMRFSNAAGKDGIVKPWYSQGDGGGQQVAVMKDVWGNDDPSRKKRDTQRIVSNDPLAMMKQGASKVRELKKERRQFQDEQAEQLKQLRREERHQERRRRRHEERDRDIERERSPGRSERRHRSRERRHDEDDGEGSRSERRKHDRDYSRDHRRSHHRRDGSCEERRDRRGRDSERHRTRDSRSPRRRDDRDRHREPR